MDNHIGLIERREFRFEEILHNNITLDLGCGKGSFLVRMAARFPEKYYIGIDYAAQIAKKAALKLEKRKINNAIILYGNFLKLLNEQIPQNSIEEIFIVCPDPWFKNRHRKRRTVTEGLFHIIHSKLRPGGRFMFITDHYPYMHLVAMEEPDLFHNPYAFPYVHKVRNIPYSTYMEKALSSDGRIYFMERIKKTGVRGSGFGVRGSGTQ